MLGGEQVHGRDATQARRYVGLLGQVHGQSVAVGVLQGRLCARVALARARRTAQSPQVCQARSTVASCLPTRSADRPRQDATRERGRRQRREPTRHHAAVDGHLDRQSAAHHVVAREQGSARLARISGTEHCQADR